MLFLISSGCCVMSLSYRKKAFKNSIGTRLIKALSVTPKSIKVIPECVALKLFPEIQAPRGYKRLHTDSTSKANGFSCRIFSLAAIVENRREESAVRHPSIANEP